MDEAKADAAIAFVKFMTSAESQAFLADELGLLPGPRVGLRPTRSRQRDHRGLQAGVEAATARPWIPEGGLFFGPLDKMATEVLIQGKDPKTSSTTAKKYKSEVVPEYSGVTDSADAVGAGR